MAQHRKAQFPPCLLRDLDEVTRIVAAVRRDDEVVLAEQVASLEQRDQAVVAPHLLVADKGEVHRVLRLHASVDQGLQREERRDERHPVVADAATVEARAPDLRLEGVQRPDGAVPLRHDVHV